MRSFFPSSQKEAARFKVEYRREIDRLQTQNNINSIAEAKDLINTLIRSHWEEHLWNAISVTCDLTMIELRDIGRLGREDGIRACGSLVRAPVIHQEVAAQLWEDLAADHGMLHGAGPDEQELFERHIAATMSEEEDDTAKAEAQRASRGIPCCVFCGGKSGQTCQLPPDIVNYYGHSELQSQTGNLGEISWQRDEMICPCQKTYEDASENESNDGHGSETSAARFEVGRSSSSASTRSSLSQVFKWGRQTSRGRST